MPNIRIHGDNIVECERAWGYVEQSLSESGTASSGPFGSVVSPSFAVNKHDEQLLLTEFFPGFKRWDPDLLSYLRQEGGLLREAPDAVICRVKEETPDYRTERPILTIEFSAALAAGNQAWQRCGRACSLVSGGLPYLYVVEVGAPELDAKRRPKAVRLPNPVVPFSYMTLSLYSGLPALPIFLPSPAIEDAVSKRLSRCFGEEELLEFIKNTLRGADTRHNVGSIMSKTLQFVNILSATRRKQDTFAEPAWEEWLAWIQEGKDPSDFICQKALPWSKTAYIKSLTKTAKSVIQETTKHAVGVGASEVPVCLIARPQKRRFVEMIIRNYPKLPDDFQEWLSRDTNLGVCWVMGFKPRGDDARPDRGLPPLARMLLGPDTDLLSFVYGPAKESMWTLFRDNPSELADRNGLWESIMAMSDAVLIDSLTDQEITQKGYLRLHWDSPLSKPTENPMPATKPWPVSIGENDVDTIIHLLMSTGPDNNVFEGMCNPPGGDWSGVSLIDRSNPPKELRWLSLPRVSKSGSKRPDHVFQFFGVDSKPIILVIESKETYRAIEDEIGGRLVRYLKELFVTPASAKRVVSNDVGWETPGSPVSLHDFEFASAVAFLAEHGDDLYAIQRKANVDLVCGISLKESDLSAKIELLGVSSVGTQLAEAIVSLLPVGKLSLSVELV